MCVCGGGGGVRMNVCVGGADEVCVCGGGGGCMRQHGRVRACVCLCL